MLIHTSSWWVSGGLGWSFSLVCISTLTHSSSSKTCQTLQYQPSWYAFLLTATHFFFPPKKTGGHFKYTTFSPRVLWKTVKTTKRFMKLGEHILPGDVALKHITNETIILYYKDSNRRETSLYFLSKMSFSSFLHRFFFHLSLWLCFCTLWLSFSSCGIWSDSDQKRQFKVVQSMVYQV